MSNMVNFVLDVTSITQKKNMQVSSELKATYSDSFRQVLKFMKSCFYSIDTWGATNEEAVDL